MNHFSNRVGKGPEEKDVGKLGRSGQVAGSDVDEWRGGWEGRLECMSKSRAGGVMGRWLAQVSGQVGVYVCERVVGR